MSLISPLSSPRPSSLFTHHLLLLPLKAPSTSLPLSPISLRPHRPWWRSIPPLAALSTLPSLVIPIFSSASTSLRVSSMPSPPMKVRWRFIGSIPPPSRPLSSVRSVALISPLPLAPPLTPSSVSFTSRFVLSSLLFFLLFLLTSRFCFRLGKYIF